MNQTKKFQFIFRTLQNAERLSESLLFETDTRDRAVLIKEKFGEIVGRVGRPRRRRPILIVGVSEHCEKEIAVGTRFESAYALASFLEVSPVTIRSTLSPKRLKILNLSCGTVQGVSFRYTTHDA